MAVVLTEYQLLIVQEDVYQLLLAHEWHGNIRELKNVVEYATAVCDDNIIQIRDLPPEFQQDRDSTSHIDRLSEKELLQKNTIKNTVKVKLIEKHNENYFKYDDPKIRIKWPVKKLNISIKDKNAKSFDLLFK